ncbi:tetratricopeptide repeat protein [Catalinimonas alkaloidigena]|nr:tetratricopeptide repeat protein [Catalinimonas alkaloidigena]
MREGIQLVKARHYSDALAYFNGVLTLEPECAVALVHRAQCFFRLGEMYLALADCSHAAEVDQEVPGVYQLRGQILYRLGDFQEAFVYFDKAILFFREDPEAYRWRAMTYLQLDNPARAVQDFQKAVALGDEDANFYLRQHRQLTRGFDTK